MSDAKEGVQTEIGPATSESKDAGNETVVTPESPSQAFENISEAEHHLMAATNTCREFADKGQHGLGSLENVLSFGNDMTGEIVFRFQQELSQEVGPRQIQLRQDLDQLENMHRDTMSEISEAIQNINETNESEAVVQLKNRLGQRKEEVSQALDSSRALRLEIARAFENNTNQAMFKLQEGEQKFGDMSGTMLSEFANISRRLSSEMAEDNVKISGLNEAFRRELEEKLSRLEAALGSI